MIAATRRLLQALPGNVVAEEIAGPDMSVFILRAPASADYRFRVLVESEEATIEAERLAVVDVTRRPADEYFWSHAFEDWRFPGGAAALEAAFHEELLVIANHETRIVQTRRFITWQFAGEYRRHDTWHPLYRHSVIRATVSVPETTETVTIYGSPALTAST